MTKIVDIHGHYVFGVDDGAETLPMALEMINSAYAHGVRNIVCTSHDSGCYWHLFCNIDFSIIIT